MNEKVGVFDERKAVDSNVTIEKTNLTKANTRLIDEARDQSIQPRFDDERGDSTIGGHTIGTGLLSFFFQSADVLPPWWSPTRDAALAQFWRNVNLLSGAMYAFASKMVTIPFHIEPRDKAITSHFQDAKRYEKRLKESAEGGAGWGAFMQKQIQSLLGQDNGRFMEIIDLSPNKDGPIIGEAISVAHLDSSRCVRKSNPEFPVHYIGRDGRQRRLHYTRVAFGAQMPSERVDMYGVGFCAVSRSGSYGRRILDINKYNEEKLGSRPMRGIVTVGGGLDAETVGAALELTRQESDSRGLERFSMLPIVGSPDIPEPKVEIISLSALPDGFDEKDTTDIVMAAIALAFGVDARELWPVNDTTKADAVLSHIKQRGKGLGSVIADTERLFDQWFLPSHLMMIFDFQDDAQDKQKAEIERERALGRKTNLEFNVTNQRVERQKMTVEGGVSTAQFKDLELEDGRLPNGEPLETLYFVDDSIYTPILTLPGISDPIDIRANDAEKVLDAISHQIPVAMEMLALSDSENKTRKAREALEALKSLARKYEIRSFNELQELQEEEISSASRDDPEAGQREEAVGPETDQETNVPNISNREASITEDDFRTDQ